MVRPEVVLRWMFALLLACSLGLALAAANSSADPTVYAPPSEAVTEPPAPESQPPCPSLELAPFEGEDAAAGEVRLLRGELTEACQALSDRLDRLRERTWWLVAEAVDAKAQRKATNEFLAESKTALEDLLLAVQDPPCKPSCPVSLVDPAQVEDAAAAEYNDKLVQAVDASGEANKSALYLIIGLLVGGVMIYILHRSVDRGT